MEITPEMKEAARKYVREGEVFKPLAGGDVGILAPTDITSKEVLTAAYRLINTALLREKYQLTAGA